MTPDALLYWLGMTAVAVSAVTGVLDSGQKRMDLIGALLVGAATALGGGTIRDLLIDRTVFWVADQTYLITALGTGLLTFFIARAVDIPQRLFLLPDALGLALFTIVGTQVALQLNTPWLVASLLGVTTGVVGGVLRDILCNEVPSTFLKGELYASAAWVGAFVLIALQALQFSPVHAAFAGTAVIFLLRLAAIRFKLTLPTLETASGRPH